MPTQSVLNTNCLTEGGLHNCFSPRFGASDAVDAEDMVDVSVRRCKELVNNPPAANSIKSPLGAAELSTCLHFAFRVERCTLRTGSKSSRQAGLSIVCGIVAGRVASRDVLSCVEVKVLSALNCVEGVARHHE